VAGLIDILVLGGMFLIISILWQAGLKAQLKIETSDQIQQGLASIELQMAAFYLGLGLVSLFYFIGSWHILGGSPGMLVLSLRVVDAAGSTPAIARSLLRLLLF